MTVAGPSQPVPALARAGDGPAVPARWPALLHPLRALVLAVLVVGLGTAAHLLADRTLPEPRLLALGAASVAAGAVLAGRRRRSFPAVAGLLLAGQAVLHAVLSLCHVGATTPAGAAVHRWLCPQDALARRWASDPLLVVGPHVPPHPATDPGLLAHLVPSPAMLLCHVAVALVAGWWLARGEAAVWAALVAAGRRVRTFLAVASGAVVARRRTTGRTGVLAAAGPAAVHAPVRRHGRRGPPLQAV